MKRLILVRHAKAKSDMPEIGDIDRPLSRSGYEEAYRLAPELKIFLNGKTLFASSPAVRAFSTAAIFADRSGFSRDAIAIDRTLYNSDIGSYVEFIQQTPDEVDTLLIFAHNPTLSELASVLGSANMDLPTCTLAVFDLQTTDWKRFEAVDKKVIARISPKS